MKKKCLLFKILGTVSSVLPPFLAVISYFPIWKERGAGTMLSGFSLCLILLCIVPILRIIRNALKSPGAPILWFVFFIIFFALSKIASDMTVICFVGFVSNLIGALFFRLGKEKRGDMNEKQI
jgi:chromate transport protein ChrA